MSHLMNVRIRCRFPIGREAQKVFGGGQVLRMSGRGGRGGGRGAYFKARYGGGRDRGSGGGASIAGGINDQEPSQPEIQVNGAPQSSANRKLWSELSKDLKSIDQAQYGREYDNAGQFVLKIDKIQADPFAAPSRVRVIMPLHIADFPKDALDSSTKRVAVKDYLTRTAAQFIRMKHMNESLSEGGGWSGPKGGSFNINAPGQEVLDRTSCVFQMAQQTVELRFTVSLPARGRTILGQEAYTILVMNLPDLISSTLLYRNLNAQDISKHVKTVLDQAALRSQLPTKNLIAFVANGSLLPRQSGAASLPMTGPNIVRFQSPLELEVALTDSNGSKVIGMGIPKGITVLSGGGFHGKSTLLEAIQMSIYDHVPGDGREKSVTDPSAFKIRAEDGRSVERLDISPFISKLPGDKDCTQFSSEDASGSTSMAANIQEALELGCKTILIDEDSSATNLLVRDQRMQALIKAEPITPFVSIARALYNQQGVSTIIVVGGCGDYLSIADTVIGMQSYLPHSLTAEARQVVAQYPTALTESQHYGNVPKRRIRVPRQIIGRKPPVNRGMKFLKLFSDAVNAVKNPAESEAGIDLSSIEQFVEPGQVRLVAEFLRSVSKTGSGEEFSDVMASLEVLMEEKGLDALHVEGHAMGDLVAARRFELGAALNRLRDIEVS